MSTDAGQPGERPADPSTAPPGRRNRDPGRGDSSLRGIMLDQSYSHPKAGATEWGAIGAIILGVAIGAIALILGVWWLAVPAVLLAVAGAVTGLVTGIMERTEDY